MKDFVDVTVSTTDLVSSPLTSYSVLGIVGIDIGTAKPCQVFDVGGATDLRAYAEAGDIPESSQAYKSASVAFQNGASRIYIVYGSVATPTYEQDATEAQRKAADDAAVFAKLEEAKDVMANVVADIVIFAGLTENTTTKFISDSTKGLAAFVAPGGAITPRIGYFMLQSGQYPGDGTLALDDPLLSTGNQYLVGFAHKAVNPANGVADVAAAMAGLTASLKPNNSIVNKGVTGVAFSGDFTKSQMNAIEGKKINAITTAYNRNGTYFAGSFKTQNGSNDGMAEGDTVRVINFVAKTLDDVLSQPNIIGTLRINYSGITILQETVLSILSTLASSGIIEDEFSLSIPLMPILAKTSDQRTAMEQATLANAVTSRTVKVEVKVRYWGVVYRIEVNPLKFVI